MAFGGWNSGNFAPPDVTQPATTVSRCDQGRWPKRDFIKVRAARRDVRLKLKMDNYKLRNAYLTEIRHISRDSRKPNEVYNVMIRLSKSAVRLQKAYYRLDLLTELVKRDIPVNNAAVLCMRACEGLSKHKEMTMRRTIMKWKLDSVRIDLRKAQRDNTNTTRECERLIREQGLGLLDRFRTVKSDERHRIRRNLDKKRWKKIDFLTKKWKHVPITEGRDYIEGVNIADRTLPDSFESEPRLYGGTNITDQERSLLSLPPRFSTYEKVNIGETECQIEKSFAIIRWQKMEEGGNNNEEENGELDDLFDSGRSMNDTTLRPSPSTPHTEENETDEILRPRSRPRSNSNSNNRDDENATGGPRRNTEVNGSRDRSRPNSNNDLNGGSDHNEDNITMDTTIDIENEEEERTTWPVDGNRINMSYLRATDLPFNKRVHLPPAIKRTEEIKLQKLKNDLLKATRK